METSESRLDESSDQPVTITGKAENGKAGAVITIDDNHMVFVEGLREWEKDVLGTTVTLTGILRRKSIYPGIRREGGMTSQGMAGIPLVLELSEPYGSKEKE